MSVISFNGISTNSPYYSHGQVKQIKSITTFTWTINNFLVCRKKTGEVIDSPILASGAAGEHKWRILLFPKGRTEDCKDYVSIFLFLVSCNESKLDVNIKFSILNDRKEEHNERRCEQVLCRGKAAGCVDFVKREFVADKTNGFLPNGNLTILCEIGTGLGPVISVANNIIHHIIHDLTISEKRLSDDFEQLLQTGKYSDITLLVHGKEFKAHKSVLAARSPVFAKMIKDLKSHKLEIADGDPEVFGEILRFMYAGKVDNLPKLAHLLLVASRKYELEGLKTMSEDALCKNLNIDNAVETLLLADINKADKLKAHIIGFIVAHAKDVTDTSGFKLIADSPQWHLLAEVFRVLALQPSS